MEHVIELLEDHSSNHNVAARDCDVDRKNKDTIKWVNDTDTAYTIHFDECPIEENDFEVGAHGTAGPYGLKPNVLPKLYSYGIKRATAKSGTMAADPNVIVH